MISLSRQREKAHENGRAPVRAFVWSLGVHALVLGAWSGILPLEQGSVAPTEPLRAVLLPEAIASPPAVMSPSRQPVVQVAKKPLAPASDAVSPKLTIAVPAEAPYKQVAASAGGMALAQPVSDTAPATLAVPPPIPARGPDAAGLRQYRLALAGEAKRFRQYPEAARRDGIAGTAEVRVTVNGGAARQTELASSSGHALLDTAALDMLRAAVVQARVPDSLRGETFAVLLPVVFSVEE